MADQNSRNPPAASAPATGTATVVVACKLPHGLVCRVHAKTEQDVPVMGGGYRKEITWVPTGEEFTLAGFAHPQNEAPRAQLSNGFALTRGIRKDLWDAWISQNAKHHAVLAGLIFAHENASKTIDETREKAKVRSGLERLDPNNLPAEFSKGKVKLQTADEQLAKPAAA